MLSRCAFGFSHRMFHSKTKNSFLFHAHCIWVLSCSSFSLVFDRQTGSGGEEIRTPGWSQRTYKHVTLPQTLKWISTAARFVCPFIFVFPMWLCNYLPSAAWWLWEELFLFLCKSFLLLSQCEPMQIWHCAHGEQVGETKGHYLWPIIHKISALLMIFKHEWGGLHADRSQIKSMSIVTNIHASINIITAVTSLQLMSTLILAFFPGGGERSSQIPVNTYLMSHVTILSFHHPCSSFLCLSKHQWIQSESTPDQWRSAHKPACWAEQTWWKWRANLLGGLPSLYPLGSVERKTNEP